MGNAGSNARDRHKSGDSLPPSSPGVKQDGQAFTFDKKVNKLELQSSNEDEGPYYTKPATSFPGVCMF
jgi:hypothetical protein